MVTASPSTVAQQVNYHSALLNRRLSIRYSCGLATATRMGQGGGLLRRVRVQDISQGGIAVSMREPLLPGEEIYLQIKNRILDFSYDLSATVRHVTRQSHAASSSASPLPGSCRWPSSPACCKARMACDLVQGHGFVQLTTILRGCQGGRCS